MNRIWHSAKEAPRMVFAGEKIDRAKLVLVRVMHDEALFEQWEYLPSTDGPWDIFVTDHQVKLWAKAGRLLHAARAEAKV